MIFSGRYHRWGVVVQVISLTVITCSLGGCSLLGTKPKVMNAGGVPLEATAGVDPDVTPFILEVVEEKNDGERLTVQGRLLPKTSKPASEVVVRLSALDRKGEQRVSFHNMQDVLAGAPGAQAGTRMLKKGVAQPFTLSMPLAGITNYQIEVLWGSEAAPFGPTEPAALEPKNEPKQFIALRNLEVHRVPTASCVSPDECIVRFTITGELFNSGSATIKDVVIEAGFGKGGNLDLPDQILENEKRVEVPNLRLEPGGAQRFKVSLDKLVASTTVVAPQPVVRIASFRSE